MGFWSKKENVLFNAAKQKVSSLSTYINGGEQGIYSSKSKWYRTVDDDPKSPMIMSIAENQYIVFYPSFSTPYMHNYEKATKYVEVLAGVLWDKVTGKKYVTGDKLIVYPNTKIEPFTLYCEAYIKVCVTYLNDDSLKVYT